MITIHTPLSDALKLISVAIRPKIMPPNSVPAAKPTASQQRPTGRRRSDRRQFGAGARQRQRRAKSGAAQPFHEMNTTLPL